MQHSLTIRWVLFSCKGGVDLEIRKVEEKPAVIHKKEHTKVRTAKRDRPRQSVFHLRDKEKREAYKGRKTGSTDIAKYRKDGLYVMGRAAGGECSLPIFQRLKRGRR
jgi:hypothetical protein